VRARVAREAPLVLLTYYDSDAAADWFSVAEAGGRYVRSSRHRARDQRGGRLTHRHLSRIGDRLEFQAVSVCQ